MKITVLEKTEFDNIWFLLMYLIISWWNILNSKKLQATVLIYKIQQLDSTRQKIYVSTRTNFNVSVHEHAFVSAVFTGSCKPATLVKTWSERDNCRGEQSGLYNPFSYSDEGLTSETSVISPSPHVVLAYYQIYNCFLRNTEAAHTSFH